MTIKTLTDYPAKGGYSDDKRRSLNAVIHQYVMDVIDIYPAYATTSWYKEKYVPLVEHGDFGKDHIQNIQAHLCILGLPARGSHKEFYEELVEFIPFLKKYLIVLKRSWEMAEPTRTLMESHDFKEAVTLPEDTPTKGITEALEAHEDTLESTLKGLDGATGLARARGRNLQNEYDDDDDDDDEEEDDGDDGEVLDFNNRMMTQIGDDNDDTEEADDETEGEQRKVAATTGGEKGLYKKGQQLTIPQLTDINSVAKEMLQSKHLEKIIAKAVRSTAAVTSTAVEQSMYTKLQGKVTEQQAINQALQESVADQKKQAGELEKKINLILSSKTTTPASLTATTKPTAVKLHPHSLSNPANRKIAEDFLLQNPNKNSNKYLNYFHEGEPFTMQPQNYADSKLPKMKIKYYVDTIGLMRNFTIHATQFGIFIHQIEEVEQWDDRNQNPPTCPYTPDLTYQCDKVYTIAANKMYTKLAHTIVFKHPVLQQCFNEAGQFADGYIALYYLQSYGNPKFRDRTIELPKPTLGHSRDITLFCRNLHNYSMYKTLVGDTPTQLHLYEYAVSQLNSSFPGEYTKGIKEVEDKINVWRALAKNPVIGPTQPFPIDADIEGSRFAFAIMRKYTEEEARALFREDGYDDDNEVITIDKAEVKAAQQTTRSNRQNQDRSRYRGERDNGGNQKWQHRETSKRKPFQKRNTGTTAGSNPWKYRDGVFCSICGSEGHEAMDDGCFATGRFLRMIKGLDQTIYRRIKQKYGDLVNIIDKKLQESIDHRASKRKERNAKINYMELADKAWDTSETEADARQVCVTCAYTIFPDIDTDSSEDEFTDAESS